MGSTCIPTAAVNYALQLVADGADVIDLGPASTHPDAKEVSPDEELRRLEPVGDALMSKGVAISVDSFRAQTQRWAIARGVAYLSGGKRNCRDVWHLRSEPTTEAHYATFPAKHARRCVLAGSRPADLVLDPFTGAGTIRCVSEELTRRWIRLDLQAEYDGITRRRTAQMRLSI